MKKPFVLAIWTLVALLAVPFSAVAAEPLPLEGILPKAETGAAKLISEHPAYDGRGVTVAIFDTGVDPGAAGLQTTSDGRPKIVDLVDGSGSGDVDTSTERTAKEGKIKGLSGRELVVPKTWKNPTGKFYIGMKRAYEFFPDELIPRLKKKRREKWDEQQRQLAIDAEKAIEKFEAEHASPSDEQKKELADLKTRLAMLKRLAKEYDDPGPTFDCVVFHDGKIWQAAIDADEDGQLDDEKLMTNYRAKRQWSTFGKEDLLNFAVNIYEEGKLLSIVADAHPHGTHVAGIVAAHYPGHPESSGLAPGAQIVSVKIGDSRIGSSSMGTGEVRGLIAVLENKCDLINMSFGGPTPEAGHGHVANLYSEIVDKHGVIWVASAGNSGPALSTVGGPAGVTEAILSVGAYVSPSLMRANYSLRKQLTEMPFTWSSRGPAYDGGFGVDVCAPGAAIAPVPQWTLQGNMMMNGTSMASPNACGAIALVLSGMKAQKIAYTPHSVRRALENTARSLIDGDVFSQGHGLIQVDKALDYLERHPKANAELLRVAVDMPTNPHAGGGKRGIYLREPHETSQPTEAQIRVRPMFHEDADNLDKVAFEMRLRLESSADWVEAPKFTMLVHGGKAFEIRVDPTALAEGVHSAEVRGYDADAPDRGPIFRFPITVVRPAKLAADSTTWTDRVAFKPGDLARRFVAVPPGATWADLKIRADEMDAPRRMALHWMQMLPRVQFDKTSSERFFVMRPDEVQTISFPVVDDRTLELCFGQYWSTLGGSELQLELTFHGLMPNDRMLEIDGSQMTRAVAVTATLQTESVAPKASLRVLRKSIRPDSAEIRLLDSPRDTLPENRPHSELALQYEFSLESPATVTPRVALTLEDDPWRRWQSMLWMIFDSNKRLVAAGGDPEPHSLDKGDYVIRFHVRSDHTADLEKLKASALLLDRNLGSPVSIGVFAHPDAAYDGRPMFGATLDRGERLPLYLGNPSRSSLPKFASPGDLLLGSISYGKKGDETGGAGQRPGGYPLSYLVPPPVKSESSSSDSSDPKEKPKSLDEKIRDLKIAELARLRKGDKKKEFDKLYKELIEKTPKHLPLLVEKLEMVDSEKHRLENLPETVAAADAVIARIDQKKLAAYFGVRHDSDEATDKEKATAKEMNQQKATLVDALYRKARAIAYMDLPEKQTEPEKFKKIRREPKEVEKRNEMFEKAYAELAKWVDPTESDYVLLHIRRERRHDRLGEALKLLVDHAGDSPLDKKLLKKQADVCEDLGWDSWRDYFRNWMVVGFPEKYPPF